MEVKLWEIIRDWLPIAGWEILSVREPDDNEGLPAFITRTAKPEEYHLKTEYDNKSKTHGDGIVMIRDSEVLFFLNGLYKHPLKAAEVDFFEKLDAILTTLFSRSEWWKKKTDWAGHREKLWPK